MINFTWKVRKLKCFDTFSEQQNVVKTVYWVCTATKDGVDFDVTGSSQLELIGDSFTAFDALTEQQVLEWCWNSNVKKSSIESAAEHGLQTKITYQLSLSENKDVPW